MVVRGCPHPGQSMPALQRDASGCWTSGLLFPASPADATCPVGEPSADAVQAVVDILPASPPHISCPVNLTSFVGALGCLAPCSTLALLEALDAAQLLQPYCSNEICISVKNLAPLVMMWAGGQGFPTGLVVRFPHLNSTLLLIAGRVIQNEFLRGSTSYLYLVVDAAGLASAWLRTWATIPSPWPSDLPFSVCYMSTWHSAPSGTANCFFDALHLHRTSVVLQALRAASLLQSDASILLSLDRLLRPSAAVSGRDICALVDHLPYLFPHGLLLVHAGGVLLFFCTGQHPQSLLPEDLAMLPADVPTLFYFDGHFSRAQLWVRGACTWFGACDATRSNAHCQFFRVLQLPILLVAGLTDTILGGAPKPLFSEAAIMAAFDAAEAVQFPTAELQALLPDVWRHCQLVADSLSVPVSWVLLAEISAASFLAPTAVLYLQKLYPYTPCPGHSFFTPGLLKPAA